MLQFCQWGEHENYVTISMLLLVCCHPSDYILTRAMETVDGMQPTEQSFLNLYIHSSSNLMFRPRGKMVW